MMSSVDKPRSELGRGRRLLAVSLGISAATGVLIVLLLVRSSIPFLPIWLLWSVLISAIELLPVPAWRGLTFSVGFPVLVAVAILYPVGAAGAIAFLGAL